MPKLWYDSPAANWGSALPLGNGHMAAMCFGGTVQDRYSLNDGTLWSSPFQNRINPDARSHLDTVRQLIREGKYTEAEVMTEETLMAIPEDMPVYEVLCELTVQSATPAHPRFITPLQSLWFQGRDMRDYEPAEGVEDYCRSLDLTTGVCRVSYLLDGIPFQRESFISHPAGVMAIRLEGGSWVLLKNTGSLAYKDETAAVGVKQYYKIVARNGDIKSDISATSSAWVIRPEA